MELGTGVLAAGADEPVVDESSQLPEDSAVPAAGEQPPETPGVQPTEAVVTEDTLLEIPDDAFAGLTDGARSLDDLYKSTVKPEPPAAGPTPQPQPKVESPASVLGLERDEYGNVIFEDTALGEKAVARIIGLEQKLDAVNARFEQIDQEKIDAAINQRESVMLEGAANGLLEMVNTYLPKLPADMKPEATEYALTIGRAAIEAAIDRNGGRVPTDPKVYAALASQVVQKTAKVFGQQIQRQVRAKAKKEEPLAGGDGTAALPAGVSFAKATKEQKDGFMAGIVARAKAKVGYKD